MDVCIYWSYKNSSLRYFYLWFRKDEGTLEIVLWVDVLHKGKAKYDVSIYIIRSAELHMKIVVFSAYHIIRIIMHARVHI